MNANVELAAQQSSPMAQTIVEYDENGQPIVPKFDADGNEIVREVFVQTDETVN